MQYLVIFAGLLWWLDSSRSWRSPVKNPKFRGCDPLGCGKYLASRDGGAREHHGLDIVTEPGQAVYAPIGGVVAKFVTDRGLTGVTITEGGDSAKVIYISTSLKPGDLVGKGDRIGTAVDIRPAYGSAITNHIHFEAVKNGTRVDPMEVLSFTAKNLTI